MKILIAVPTYENIQPETFKAIYNLDKCGHWVVFDYVRGYDVATARNNIAKKALEEKADYVLTIDNDVRVPNDALKLLLEEPVDVCLGFCARRTSANVFDGLTTISKLGEFNYTKEFLYSIEELRDLREKGVKREQVHGGGLPCALIKTSVFEKLKYPYFKWSHYDRGTVLSEDLFFCEQLKEKKIPIYVDPRCACDHLFRRFEGAL